MSTVYVGDTGTEIKLDTLVDLSLASVVSIEVKKPDNSIVSWPGTKVETSKIKYVTLANTLNLPGNWKLQAKATLPSGSWTGATVVLRVLPLFG
jgi:hypothetical protein